MQEHQNEDQQNKKKSIVDNDANYTLDAILVRIGQFGKFQIFTYILLCFPIFFDGLLSLSYVFTASSVEHRCNITLCDSPSSVYMEPWVDFTIPLKGKELDQCTRYISNNSLPEVEKLMTFASFVNEPSTEYCKAENFERNRTEKCGKDFKFRDKELTISNEFGIFCSDDWKLAMVGTVTNVGQFVGIPLGGFFADKYGRRTVLATAGTLCAIMGVISSFSVNYYMFLVFEFLGTALGSTMLPTAFLLAIEWVGPNRRVAAATFISPLYSLGEVLLAALAQKLQNWRWLMRVMYLPSALQILFFWILPESVRWLLSQGKEVQATESLQRAAKANKRKISMHSLEKLVENNRDSLENAHESLYPIKAAIKLMHWRILNCSFCWFTHTLVTLGLSLRSVNMGGNKYTNFMLNGLVEIPGILLPLLIIDRVGRRFSLFGSMIACGVCIAATAFVGSDNYALELTFFLIGKFAIACSFQLLYFLTSEIFPTNMRNSLLSFCSMIGRIGSILAPQTPLLAEAYEYAPQILFTSATLISGCLVLLLPETAHKVLPMTMEEANNLSDNKKTKFPDAMEDSIES